MSTGLVESNAAASQVKKVLFLGAPSTGKSTIAEALANEFNTKWVHEYGREYWEQNHIERRLSPEELLHIAQEHVARENQAIVECKGFLFVDTSALTTWHFAHDYYGKALPELDRLAQESESRYDHVFLCEDDIPFHDTPERSGLQQREKFQKEIRAEIEKRGIQCHSLSGSKSERIEKVKKIITQKN